MTEAVRNPAGLLLLPRLEVQNANAISGPLSWGFPAPSALLGFVHALERRLSTRHDQAFDGVGIVCHDFSPQVFRPNRRQHLTFTQTRNPVYLKRDIGKFIADGTPSAIVEEGRAHLQLSLVIALRHPYSEALEGEDFAADAYRTALGMRLAGGSVLPAANSRIAQPQWLAWPDTADDQRKAFARLRRRLLPGFALVHRPDLLAERLIQLRAHTPSSTALDALLDLSRVNHIPAPTTSSPALPSSPADTDRSATRVEWQVEKRPGWLVPLPIGYAGISPLYAPGDVAGSRDTETPFRFVESLYSVGQWIGPHRLTDLAQMLWHSTANVEAGLYHCINRYSETLSALESETHQGV